ncbi:nicotinate-nucleotide-dimethylbenzimidazole phosphoribosyltransferase [Aquabacterium commune]|uniref:Nicotinate-nucleotide--dimethylbenzimidazole phosphoribosyltransferase n=2 Tax=Aquabacterium commune TaxID=70586 RepID=A0A4V3CWY5_9BURK|nr:nicotinate-nucleotide--dimethylbenzimidazole phosphoribosyltransferase [Aquabacterium commune]TDP88178.1 nicotinate-nucleotide-dimethylbenzimidazole phosphoribosyltransferase [Aquabacterium commune]
MHATPHDLIPQVADLHDAALAARLQHLLDHKTKPLGSLGRIEGLARQIGLVLGSERPVLQQPQMVVFAGDHGLAARGVSAFPAEVTAQMVANFLGGGAAVSVLARQHGLALTVVDAGVASALPAHPGLVDAKVAPGTADCTQGPAMSAAQCEQALRAGADVVRGLQGNALLLGEMGIGNTSSASLLMARLSGQPLTDCVGRGTGLDRSGLVRKLAVLQEALHCHAEVREPLAVLAAFGGFEIAMMVGAILQAAAERRVIVVDGFIVSSAVLVAQALQPQVLQRCVFSHQSDESGHARMLAHLGAEAVLKLDLRLGEGSGAALAWPLLVSACHLLCDMASFEAAGVSTAGGGTAEPRA